MALPVSFSGIAWGFQNNTNGPYKASDKEAFYIVGKSAADGTKVRALKATDPTSSWATTIDSAANPDAINITQFDSTQWKNVIHVTAQWANSGGDDIVGYTSFNIDSETWASWTVITTITSPRSNNNTDDGKIEVRATHASDDTDAETLICYSGDTEKVHGTDYSRVYAKYRASGGWGSELAIPGSTGIEGNFTLDATVVGGGDPRRIHVFCIDNENFDVEHSCFLSTTFDATEDQVIDYTGSVFIRTCGTNALAYDNGSGTVKCRVPTATGRTNAETMSAIEFDSAVSPSFTINERTANDVYHPTVRNGVSAAMVYVPTSFSGGTDEYTIFVDRLDRDVDRDLNDGTDTSVVSGITAEVIMATYYDRDGGKIGFLYDDAGTNYYNEIDVGKAAVADLDDVYPAARFSYGGPFQIGSALYQVGLDVTQTRLMVVKASNASLPVDTDWDGQDHMIPALPKAHWEQDPILSFDAVEFGSDIHIVTQQESGRVAYHLFDPGTDTWTTQDEGAVWEEQPTAPGCAIAVRTGPDVIVQYSHDVQGSVASQVYYTRRESGTWAAPVALSSGSNTWKPGVCVLGTSDRVHFFFSNDFDSDGFQRTLTSANSLQSLGSAFDASLDATATAHFGHGVLDGTQVVVPVLDGSAVASSVELTSADTPTPSLDINASVSQPIRKVNGVPQMHCFLDPGGTVRLLYITAAGPFLYYNTFSGTTWFSSWTFPEHWGTSATVGIARIFGAAGYTRASLGWGAYVVKTENATPDVIYEEVNFDAPAAGLSNIELAGLTGFVHVGPFERADDVYCLAVDARRFTWYLMKAASASDPTTDASWSVVNQITIPKPAPITSIDADIDSTGTKLHVAVGTSNRDYWYYNIELVDDGFDAAENPIFADFGRGSTGGSVSIAVRTDGDVILLYQENDTDVSYAREEGSWTIDVEVGGGGGSWVSGVVVEGLLSRMHFFFSKTTATAGLYQRTLTPANSLQSLGSAFSTAHKAHNDGDSIFMKGTPIHQTDRVACGWLDSSDDLMEAFLDSADTPSVSTAAVSNPSNAVYDKDVPRLIGGMASAGGATDATLALWVDEVTQDIFRDSKPSGGGWGTDQEELDAVTVGELSCRVIDHGDGDVLGYIYDDNGTPKYGERVLAAATPVSRALAAAFESLLGLAPSELLPFESTGVASQTAAPPFESILELAPTELVSFESVLELAPVEVVPFETLLELAPTETVSFEALLGSLLQTGAVSFESLEGVAQTELVPIAALGRVAPALVVSFEAFGVVSQTGPVPFESILELARIRTVAFESLLGNLLQTGTVPFEALEGVLRTGLVPFESTGVVTQTGLVPLETLLGLSPAEAIALESILGLAPSSVISFESILELGQTSGVAFESIGTAVQTTTAAFEAIGAITRALAAAFESLEGVPQTAPVPFEARGAAIGTGTVALESLLGLAPTEVVSFESLLELARIRTVAFESLLGLAPTRLVSFEAIGTASQTGVLSFESILGLAPTGLVPFESILELVKTGTAPFETLLGLARTRLVSFEAIGSIIVVRTVSFEALQGAIAQTGTGPFEALGRVAQTETVPIAALGRVGPALAISFEAIGTVGATVTVSFESMLELLRTGTVPFEALQGAIAQTGIVPLEALEGVPQTGLVPFEATGVVESQEVASFESILGLTPTGLVPFESLVGVTPSALVAYESLLELLQADPVSFEAIGTAATTATVSLESLATLVKTGVVPLESIASAVQSAGVAYESFGTVIATAVVPIAALGRAVAAGVIPLETLVSIGLGDAVAFESQGAVAVGLVVPVESLIALQQADTAFYEAIGVVAIARAVPFESTTAVIPVSNTAIVAFEALARAVADGVIPFETLGQPGFIVTGGVGVPVSPYAGGVAAPILTDAGGVDEPVGGIDGGVAAPHPG